MRIAISCREPLLAEALQALLEKHGRLNVVANLSSIPDVVMAAKRDAAHVLLIDTSQLGVPDYQYLMGARAMGDFAIVLITPSDEEIDLMGLQVDGVISRLDNAIRLYQTLQSAARTTKGFAPTVREGRKAYGVAEENVLSRREYEVAQLVAKGMSNRGVAQITGLREQSVKNLVSVIMRKLRCDNRVQVALKLVNAPVATLE